MYTRKRHKLSKRHNKVTKRKSKRGGTDHVMVDTSIPDDVCGIGWQYIGEPKTQTVISEKVYQTMDDRLLVNIILSNEHIPNEFNNYVTKIIDLVNTLYKINNSDISKQIFKANPFIFMKTNLAKLEKKVLENTPKSWISYGLFDGTKPETQDGYMSKERFDEIIDAKKINITYNEGTLLVQNFNSRMMVVITMIILELDTLKIVAETDGNVAKLFDIISIDDLNRRAKILEDFAWFSIDSLRKIYKTLTPEQAMQMVVGSSDPKEFIAYQGFFGDSHYLGAAIWSKTAGKPSSRLSKDNLGCYDIFVKNKKTEFWLNNNNLLFKSESRTWWAQTTSLKRMVHEENVDTESLNELFPENIRAKTEPGIYIKTEKPHGPQSPGNWMDFIHFNFDIIQNNKATISGGTANHILKILDDSKITIKKIFVIINSKLFSINPKINATSKQLSSKSDGPVPSDNITPIKLGTGGKIFIVNENSLSGLINKWRGTLAVAGPSGTAWFILSTALLFNDYNPSSEPYMVGGGNNLSMIHLILSLIVGICTLPHHSIEEVVLAASAPPIKVFDYDINMTNKEAIAKIGEGDPKFSIECNAICQSLNNQTIAKVKLPTLIDKFSIQGDRRHKMDTKGKLGRHLSRASRKMQVDAIKSKISQFPRFRERKTQSQHLSPIRSSGRHSSGRHSSGRHSSGRHSSGRHSSKRQ